jgi:hypothetical protein
MTNSQIFKSAMNDKNYIINFITHNFIKDNLTKSYISDVYTFKKLLENGKILELYHHVYNYYHNSKKNYPKKIFNYRGFNTTLRQISKYYSIKYKYFISYTHSTYMIKYVFTLTHDI